MPPESEILQHSEILRRARRLKPFDWDQDTPLSNQQRWVDITREGVRTLTKPRGAYPHLGETKEHLVLTLKGKVKYKQKVAKDFVEALGKPLLETSPQTQTSRQTIVWDAKAVQQPKEAVRAERPLRARRNIT